MGGLAASGADADAYNAGTNAAVAVYQPGAAADTVNKGIVPDSNAFFVNIYHNATLPVPGATTLDLPITSYTK